jgi:hypothetical protein
MLKGSTFADVTGSVCGLCPAAENVYVKNDGAFDFDGSVVVVFTEFASGVAVVALNASVTLKAGAQTMRWMGAGALPPNSTHGVTMTIRHSSGIDAAHKEMILAPPHALKLPTVTATAAVAAAPNADGSVDITVTATGGAAVYTVLTTKAQGRFSDNAFLVAGGGGTNFDTGGPGSVTSSATFTKRVSFLPWGPLDIALLKSSLRVEHLQENL